MVKLIKICPVIPRDQSVFILSSFSGVTSFVMSYFRKLDPTKVQMDFALMNDVPSPYYDEIIERGSKIFILPPINNVYHHLSGMQKDITRWGLRCCL